LPILFSLEECENMEKSDNYQKEAKELTEEMVTCKNDIEITDQDALFFQVFQPYSKKLETIFLKGCKNTVKKSELSEEKWETLLETINENLESAEDIELKDLLLIFKE